LIRVVAAAIVRDGAVLAARRSRPPALAGGWEFPGGKVEADETDVAALRRECREELGVDIAVGPLLGEASDGRIVLQLHVATLLHGEPCAGIDHDELRWLPDEHLDTVEWLAIDRELLPFVRPELR
jgi:8-oxo-dGTP diphosphatase